jgi:AraC-like DNA-binding protein
MKTIPHRLTYRNTTPIHPGPIANALDSIRSNPFARRFDAGELFFAEFDSPEQEAPASIWSETDHLVHVLSARARWKTLTGVCTAEAGQSVFIKKGAYTLPPHSEEKLRMQVFFIPDAFVRNIGRELATQLPAPAPADYREQVIRLNGEPALSAFFQAMTAFFSADEAPPEALLELRLGELLAGILVGRSNPALSAYLRSVAARQFPPISTIMEANFCHNLPMTAFARLCQRSLSSFKRDFRKQYDTSPGRWLLKRRLERAARLLETTSKGVTEVMLECGFEDLSHFSRTFKEKIGQSPSAYRGALSASA